MYYSAGILANMRSLSPSLRYDVALLYLEQTDYNLEAAIEAYKEDERWEREHPLEGDKGKKKKSAANAAMRRFVGGSR